MALTSEFLKGWFDMKTRKSDSYFDPLRDMKSEWIDEAIDSGKVAEKHANRINLKKIVSVAACLAILIVGTTCIINAEEISNAIRSLFVREQELIDPYAVVNTGDGQEDITKDDTDPAAMSLKVDKVFIDGEFYYVYINIHNPARFERTFLYYEGIGIYTADGKKVEGAFGSREDLDPNLIAITGTNIQGEYVSETDFEATIKLSRRMDSLPQGNYSFRIYGLTEAKLLDDPDEASMKWYEEKIYNDMISDDFTVGENGISPLPSRTIQLDTEFEVEGYKFVVDEITISPMSVEFTVTDELHQVMEIGDMHFDAISMFCGYSFCEEFDRGYHSSEEYEVFNQFLKDHDIFIFGDYEIAFELEEDAKKYWHGGSRYIDFIMGTDGEERNMLNIDGEASIIKIKAMFTGPIYEDEILAIGFFKDIEEIPAYDERYGHYIDVEVWRNSAE